jgi:transposase-like protein
MDLARYVVDAVVLEGRSYREVARAHGVSKSYVGKLVGRFRDGGYEAIAPRSRAPGHVPHRTPTPSRTRSSRSARSSPIWVSMPARKRSPTTSP